MIEVDGTIYPQKGDTIKVIKDWDVDDNHWRRTYYTKGWTFITGAIGQETQLPYYKYPEYFKVVDKTTL